MSEITWYAVFELKKTEGWKLIPSFVEIKEDDEHLVVKCPEPLYLTGDTIFVPTKYWYRTEEIAEVEPIISKDKEGNRVAYLGYWVNGPGISILDTDFFASKYKAVKRAWSTLIRDWCWNLRIC